MTSNEKMEIKENEGQGQCYLFYKEMKKKNTHASFTFIFGKNEIASRVRRKMLYSAFHADFHGDSLKISDVIEFRYLPIKSSESCRQSVI